MSVDDPRLALAGGVLLGLLVSAIVIAIKDSGGAVDAPRVRPGDVPSEAVWLDDVFGEPRWLHCVPEQKRVACTAYSRSGAELVTAVYVPLSGKAGPAAPLEHFVAREVDKIWINKVAMVPDGAVELPAAKESLDYAVGERRTDPTQ